jgi:hypothetical protein
MMGISLLDSLSDECFHIWTTGLSVFGFDQGPHTNSWQLACVLQPWLTFICLGYDINRAVLLNLDI